MSLLFQNVLHLISPNDDLMSFCFFSVFVTAHSVVLYVTWEQQKAMHEACASIRSKMADVKPGGMPSELAPRSDT